VLDLDQLIDDCRGALADPIPQVAVKDVLARAMATPAEVEAALPAKRAELTAIHHSPDLTILKVVWAPQMVIPPHDHRMWAAIGIYGGGEDNTFFRRAQDGIVETGGQDLRTRDTLVLGDDVIHSVTNPRRHDFTGSIHIYGGDYFGVPRSLWDAETLEEGPADGARLQHLFEDANARLTASDPGPG
jgi:predicted metal-dependent enzyme (double-stranded beta helix superfamily)